MQMYIEKMIQEKASVILTQYRSRLKRSHATSPDGAEQSPPQKYQIIEHAQGNVKGAPRGQVGVPVGTGAPPVALGEVAPQFPMTAISLTGT